jgi:tetratricopeptide (TPR) repeat protein
MSPSDPTPLPSRPARSADGGSRWFGELGLVDFQIEMFDRILARNPNDISILRALGELLALRGQYERSLEIDRRLVALAPRDCTARYNLACRLAVQGSTGAALEELGRAMQFGYEDFEHLEFDSDLDNLRDLPEYRALLREYGIPDSADSE